MLYIIKTKWICILSIVGVEDAEVTMGGRKMMILGVISAIFLGVWMWGVSKSIERLEERVDGLEELIDTDDEVEK